MFRIAKPHAFVECVEEISLEMLAELGVENLLLDVDSTLKPYRAKEVTPEVADWLDTMRSGGIRMCLASNGLGKRIERFAADIDLPFIAKALKPFPFRIRKAIAKMGFEREKTAMVGDQVFADIIAGRLAGLTTIHVRAIHPEQEHWFTRLKRPPERCLLWWMRPKKD